MIKEKTGPQQREHGLVRVQGALYEGVRGVWMTFKEHNRLLAAERLLQNRLQEEGGAQCEGRHPTVPFGEGREGNLRCDLHPEHTGPHRKNSPTGRPDIVWGAEPTPEPLPAAWQELYDAAPDEAKDVIRERASLAAVVDPIVQAWKARVAELEAKLTGVRTPEPSTELALYPEIVTQWEETGSVYLAWWKRFPGGAKGEGSTREGAVADLVSATETWMETMSPKTPVRLDYAARVDAMLAASEVPNPIEAAFVLGREYDSTDLTASTQIVTQVERLTAMFLAPETSTEAETIVDRIQHELRRSYLAGADMPGSEPPKQFGCIPKFRREIATICARTLQEPEELPFPEFGAVTLCMAEDGDVLAYRCDTIPKQAKLLARGDSVEDAWLRMVNHNHTEECSDD